jgi:3-hydroxybutyrate dehydrogenase
MLTGKTALVTGSTSGIGLGIARALAVHGCRVVLNGFGDVDAAKAAFRGIDGEVGYHPADMSKPDQIADMMGYVQRTVGPLDILVNNAGIQHVAPVEDFPVEKWDAILAINLTSAFHTTRLALPSMKSRNWGRILNIASAHGLVASAQKSAYVASKHGLIGFTKALALENGRKGVTVNCIAPGYIDTEMLQAVPEKVLEGIVSQIAVGRLGKGEEIADMVAYLAGERAGFVTGATLTLNGGQFMAG